jgi:hypothetical protein
MGAGVPEGLAVLGVFKGVQIFFGHGVILLFDMGEGIKNTHPLKNQGWDTDVQYSTVPPWLRHMPSLIDALTGAPVRPFPTGGSEVVSFSAGLQMPCTKTASSLGILPETHVFVAAFIKEKIS